MGLSRWFPASCSSLSIFVCYAHEDRRLAEEIAQALTNDGHNVFIDANKLKVSGDFNETIRRAIERADRFIFLISKASMGQGKYPQTELDFAKDRWPSPQGKVWPVLVDPSVDISTLPVYLRAVQIHTVKGNAPAEIAAAIEKTRTLRASCLAGTAVALAAVAGLAGFFLTGGWERMTGASYVLLKPQQADFRPAQKPGPDDGWTASRLALTLIPVNYSNDSGKPVNVIEESVSMKINDRSVAFKWFNEVEMKPACADWLCIKTSVGAQTLERSLKRETMFMPASGQSLTWREFLDGVCNSKDETLDVVLSSKASSTGVGGTVTNTRQTICKVDLKAMREGLEKIGCKSGLPQPPVRLSPNCL
jgi:hypothetical protein